MRKEAQVTALLANNTVQLIVKRDSACGDCASCGGCESGKVLLTVTNTLNAKKGDKVYVETASGVVIAIAALVYLLPIFLFFLGCAVAAWLAAPPILIGGIAFVAALLAVILLNRRLSAKIGYHMTGFAEEN